jgi:hydrogenase expression/formation protein HypE
MKPKIPTANFEGSICALPLGHHDKIVMGHGSGGRMTQDLIQKIFRPYFSNEALDAGDDFATIAATSNGRIAISTDAHIVSPLFFPGGNIGRLAVCGTVNDVAMSGAKPYCLTASFILEEGLLITNLEEIVKSMAFTAKEAGVFIAAGDTKVVEKGKGDGVFISTTGIGYIPEGVSINGANAKPGDAILISGTLGEHGIAVLTARGDLRFENEITSDVAPLNGLIQKLITSVDEIHVLRDPTRGGLATTLNEIASQSNVNITIEESKIPILPAVRSACELLGFDPLYVANEGKVIIILPDHLSDQALNVLHKHPYGKNAVKIGEVKPSPQSRVLLRTPIGSTRILDVMSGEMLPRIC